MTLKEQYQGFLDSEPLWSQKQFGLQQFPFGTIKFSTNQKSPFDIEIGKNEVLGKRVEHFFEYAIHQNSEYELIAKNQQVFKDKITLGELDFLLKDLRSQEIIHVELIYKFYIYDPSKNGEIEKWIGPNKKDSLPQKLEKLQNHQLPLLNKKETLPVLDKLNMVPANIQQEVCYLANLFIPFGQKQIPLPYINAKCIAGYWIHSNDFSSETYHQNLFHIPQKQNWMVHPKHCTQWYSYPDIKEQVILHLDQKKSPLLWMKSNGDQYIKFFIVWW